MLGSIWLEKQEYLNGQQKCLLSAFVFVMLRENHDALVSNYSWTAIPNVWPSWQYLEERPPDSKGISISKNHPWYEWRALSHDESHSIGHECAPGFSKHCRIPFKNHIGLLST